jgi:hypothetical protein
MIKKLLIGDLVVLALGVGSFFIPAQQLNIEGIGRLSFETNITLSVGSETAYASPDLTTNSPSADSGSWTNPTNAYADGGGYASITSGTPSASQTYYNYGFNLTGNTINQVRVRYDAWCTGSANSQTRYPTGDAEVNGTWTLTPAGGSRYQKVDETPADDSDYIALTTAAGGYSYFSFSNFSVPSGSTVNNVTVYYRHRDTAVNISYVGTANSTGNNPTNGSFSLPSGWAAGDTAVFWWYTYANTKTFTAPAGVTQKQQASASGYGRIYIGYRGLQSGDTTFPWTSGSVANSTTIWGTSVFRGVDPTGDPFEAQSGAPATFSNSRNPDPPAVTTVSNNAWVIPIFGKNNDYTGITPPTSYTSAGSNSSTSGNDACAGVAYRQIAAPGPENPGAWTLSGGRTNDDGYVWTGALKPTTTSNTRAALKVNGTLYGTTDAGADPTASWADRNYVFTTNPATGAAWTVADVNGIQAFGINSTDSSPNIQISQCYAVVNYTAADEQIRVDVSWDGGISWSPPQTTTLTGAEATYWYDVTSATVWTPDKLSDANLRVRVDAYTQGVASEVRLDWIPVAVDYTPPIGCWLSGWAKRTKLTIDHNDITSPLANIPVLVYLSSASGRATPKDDVTFVFDELQNNANRFKIAVTDNSCNQLYVEIEKWDQASEQAWLWVKVPSISDTTDTILHLYYDRNHADNTAYVGDTNSTPAETVWDGNFALVQHLGENASVVHDSTANNNDETNPPPEPPSPGYLRATYTDSGRINGAYSFSNNGTNGSRLQMANSSSLDITEAITLEAFVYLNDKTDSKFIVKDDPFDLNGSGCYNLQQEALSGTPNLQVQLDLGGWQRASYPTYNTGEWLYVVGTYDRTTLRLYLNGTEVATNPQTAAIRSDSTVNVGLGNRADDWGLTYDLNGLLDEVRISNAARNPAWIKASYESGRDDLIDFGPEEGMNISNTPSTKDFGYVGETHSYWSNGAAPVFPLDDGECFFTLTNNSSAPADITIRATNFTGGTGWTLAGTPGVNIVTLKAGKSGDNAEGDMVIVTTGDQSFITSMPAFSNRKWEIKLDTGTFSDGVPKSSTITLTASIA